MGEVREPIKKSSIEKKQRIVQKGFELMCREGFHNVNCADIARYASVSTGIIYQYFSNKRDIFLEGVRDYSNSIIFPMSDIIDDISFDKNKLDEGINKILDIFTSRHTMDKREHEELMAMSHLDDDIAKIFYDNEIVITEKIAKLISNYGFNEYHLKERVHIIISIVDNYCHEVVYHKHREIDQKVLKEEVVNTILFLLK